MLDGDPELALDCEHVDETEGVIDDEVLIGIGTKQHFKNSGCF